MSNSAKVYSRRLLLYRLLAGRCLGLHARLLRSRLGEQDYANTSRGQYRLTRPDASDMLQAVQDFMSNCPRTPSDVYIKDDVTDFGTEPSTAASIYMSPDIKVCTSANGCPSSVNPVFGSANNNVFVTLRNNGPKVATGPVAGSLYVYYSASGGGALWPNHWTLINVEHGLYLNPNEIREVRLGWANVPAAGHYCLLARWVSQGDPMAYPELIGSNTRTWAPASSRAGWRVAVAARASPWPVEPP
ncbi:hypothetical protein JQX13_46260 [Archangium violaceum]|uniref:hypothetical protein n=1 Tax=Archangium violaceum TaxID=83451 RepID=UPI00193B6DAC|nr:hypothetical protein [Archangium violaceum]QRK14242.1 hypothetical protein JQX13_46260 [Archangium violaceum]